MPFRVVSWVSREVGVLDGGPHASREGEVLGVFCSIGLNGIFFNRNVFDSCVEN